MLKRLLVTLNLFQGLALYKQRLEYKSSVFGKMLKRLLVTLNSFQGLALYKQRLEYKSSVPGNMLKKVQHDVVGSSGSCYA